MKIEWEKEENGIKITRIAPIKNTVKTFIRTSSRIQHQKGSFGSRPPTGNGVSSIYQSIYNRVPRNGSEGKTISKVVKRAW